MKGSIEQYKEIMESDPINDPIERLRFFLSIALSGQDWLDVEPLFDDISVTQNTAKAHDGVRWYPVRQKTAENTFLWHRVKAAWRVLTGKSDAIEWDCHIGG